MAGGVVANLRATLGLNGADFSRGLAKAKQEAQNFHGSLNRIGASLKGALGLTVAGVGLNYLASSMRDTVKSVAMIGDEAKRAGLSTTAFQQWQFVADQNRISIDALVDGFKELSLRADEFIVTGGGSGADAFKRLGFSASDLRDRLKDPSALMLEIIGRLGKLDRAAQIRVSDEIFGGAGGEQFLHVLDQGEGKIRDMITRGHEVGAVVDEKMIQKAQELDRRWNEVISTIDRFKKSLVVDVADGLEQLFDNRSIFDILMGDEAEARARLGDALYDVAKNAAGLTDAQKDLVTDVADIVTGLVPQAHTLATTMGAAGAAVSLVNADLGASLQDVSSEMKALISDWQAGEIEGEDFRVKLGEIVEKSMEAAKEAAKIDGVTFGGIVSGLGALVGALDLVAQKGREAKSALPAHEAKAGGEFFGPPKPEYQLSELAPTGGRASKAPPRAPAMTHELVSEPKKAGGGGGAKKQDDYADRVKGLREVVAGLEAETAALALAAASGMTYSQAVEYARARSELLMAAQRDGKKATPQLVAEIDKLALAYVKAGEDAEAAGERMAKVKEQSDRGADAITDLFVATAKGSDAAKAAVVDLLAEIGRAQLLKGVSSLFGGASLFLGGLLGRNSVGTNNWRGGLTRVNELGGEIMNLPGGTQIIPHDISKRMVDRAAAGAQSVHVTVGIDRSSGNLTAFVDDRADLAAQKMGGQVNKAMPGRLSQINNQNPRRR